MTRISLHRTDYDLIILDLMLPSMDGYEICKEAREKGVTVPILILTARAETETKVDLLLSGADDYLVKPFSFEEFLARVRALMRRRGDMLPSMFKVADLEMDSLRRRVTRAGKNIVLTQREYEMLEYFLRHPNEVVTRAALAQHVWQHDFDTFSNVIDVLVGRLRRKIDGDCSQKLIETVRGSGYLLRAPEDL